MLLLLGLLFLLLAALGLLFLRLCSSLGRLFLFGLYRLLLLLCLGLGLFLRRLLLRLGSRLLLCRLLGSHICRKISVKIRYLIFLCEKFKHIADLFGCQSRYRFLGIASQCPQTLNDLRVGQLQILCKFVKLDFLYCHISVSSIRSVTFQLSLPV